MRQALLLSLAVAAHAGSLCPSREDIYPCSCANIHQTKKLIHTVVSCHRINDAHTLTSVFGALRSMQIDQLHLYDIFADAQGLQEDKKVLPVDWLKYLKVKEFEIVDSSFSFCFACEWKTVCSSPFTIRFTALNMTSSEKICTLCNPGTGNKLPWTGCMAKLKQFQLSYGQLAQVGADFFPKPMTELTVLNFTHNRIGRIDSNAFTNLPRVMELDLSHNALVSINNIFGVTELKYLQILDVSYNSIATIGNSLSFVPNLKTFIADRNEITDLKEAEWNKASGSLKIVQLNDNPLHCGCSIRWVNTTFHQNTLLYGKCITPPEYENFDVRRASRFLNERCDDEGVIGTRPRKATTPSSL